MPEPTTVSKKKKALGRGLGSLLGGPSKDMEVELPPKTAEDYDIKELKEEPIAPPQQQKKPAPTVPPTARIWKVGIDKIIANPNQPRKVFEKEALQELANSIKEKGILQPITVRKVKDKFEIIAGERRWRAAQIAQLHEVPVILRESDTQDALELALIENIQREDLNPIEEAQAFSYLMEKYKMTQQNLAEKVGKERATVANTLRLLKLAPQIQNMVSESRLSMGQVKPLLSIEDHGLQKKMAMKTEQLNLSVRAVEKMVKKWNSTQDQKNNSDPMDSLNVSERLIKGLSEELQKVIGTKVSIDYSNGKGKINIKFYSDEELNNIVDTIRESWQKSKN